MPFYKSSVSCQKLLFLLLILVPDSNIQSLTINEMEELKKSLPIRPLDQDSRVQDS